MYSGACVYVHVCGSQRSMSGTFLSHFPTLFLRQVLSLNLELGNSARLAIKAQGASCLWLPSTGSTSACHYAWFCMWLQGKLNLGPPAFLRTLLNYLLSPYVVFLTSEGTIWEFRPEICLTSLRSPWGNWKAEFRFKFCTNSVICLLFVLLFCFWG